MFDTRVKLDEPDGLDVPTDDTAVASAQGGRKVVKDITTNEGSHVKGSCDGDTVISIDAACNIDGDSNTNWDSDSDSGSIYNCDEDSDTDDDCDTGPEETRSFLYRHFTISIVAN